MDRTAGKESGHHAIPHLRYGDKVALSLLRCSAPRASSSSRAKPVLNVRRETSCENHLTLRTTPSANTTPSSDQIRLRCSGVENDYGRDVCKFVCPP